MKASTFFALLSLIGACGLAFTGSEGCGVLAFFAALAFLFAKAMEA